MVATCSITNLGLLGLSIVAVPIMGSIWDPKSQIILMAFAFLVSVKCTLFWTSQLQASGLGVSNNTRTVNTVRLWQQSGLMP